MPSTRLILGLAATTAAAAAPVKVFIMMGQSNMLGEGNVSPVTKNGTLEFAVEQGKYPYLGKGEGAWTYSKNVRNVFTMGSGGPNSAIKMQHNDWMGVNTTIKSQVWAHYHARPVRRCPPLCGLRLPIDNKSPLPPALPSPPPLGSSSRLDDCTALQLYEQSTTLPNTRTAVRVLLSTY